MVKRLLILFFLLPIFLFSGEFVSSVNRNPVSVGESFTLSLTLKDASAKRSPTTDQLNQIFYVQSQQQSSNTSIINGKSSSSTTWRYTLIPRAEGETTIPSIKIETSEGVLSSRPIVIQVSKKGSTNNSGGPAGSETTIAVDVSNAKPYKNEPIVYTVKLMTQKQLANLQMEKFAIDDAIVEPNGEPKVYAKTVNGVNVNQIEFSYLITPLKAGSLNIPSAVIQGLAPNERKSRRASYFDDEFDPFSILQGFDRYKPFALATEELVLDVRPSVAGMSPWIPAKSLTIEEQWDESQLLRVGEPLTRIINISAEGLKASQLPGLNEAHTSNTDFKMYADKPEFRDVAKDGAITSSRKEQFTLIPQQAGTLTLPEIAVAWWDVTKDEKVVTRLPSRTLHIQPAPMRTDQSFKHSQPVENAGVATIRQPPAEENGTLLYSVVTILALLLAAALTWVMILRRKIRLLTKSHLKREKYNPFAEKTEKSNGKEKKEKLPDLNPT